ncbi:EAL domain-containing protein [Acidovorax sp. Leaf73]|jgi:EAL domain-containing protein (putative c-di-GMP-specific phosphodiesterase class I)/DNA-binding NarL/FixJ family response regulator|uniref:EAL domain-containing response regulator n=1 Tax=Acidovorax sp. Leaf73 TaxID=2876566 RepID=UPI001E49CE51|nr:EAL domain-containing response regulator [Acidovorax sp. Leaf73]
MIANSAIRILVLDDESFMLKLMTHLLAKLGFTNVTTCDTGLAALNEVDQASRVPHLILCDLNMPGMDGLEFVRKLVEHGYVGSLILVSGEDERTLQSARTLVQAHHIEVLGSLHKPVSPQALFQLVERWVPPAGVAHHHRSQGYGAERLAEAIRAGELTNYYQPKVHVSTGEMAGVETLVRWRHPQDGMVFPDQFIGVAEGNGLIDALTQVVLGQALRDCAGWARAGLQLKVAVNVSMDSLNALEFPEQMTSAAASAGIAPQSIVLEVTESQLMKDLRAPLEILTRLRLRRFKLSIDDFGTGHSSLAQLRDVPFDELKIDRSFVHGAHHNETLRAILLASLRLAKELNMEVVAEGVEDAADWFFLQSAGCDLAQGYFIARPMPAERVAEWAAEWPHRWEAELLGRASVGPGNFSI